MNIFVPAEYLDGQGNVLHEEIRMGYTASTAPVIFENGLAGYHEAEPFELDDHRSMGVEAVLAGFVYVSCGCRGRSSVDEKGVFCGKAPVSVADLKAGIRFLKKKCQCASWKHGAHHFSRNQCRGRHEYPSWLYR